MIERRQFQHLGQFSNDWLSARYHFSFADYHHDARMGCGVLRVWNDDAIQPGTGFNPHSHRDMEIVTYIRQGAITHHDSLGNVGRTEAGQVQVMSAGRGITHAEYNRESEITTLFQIWLLPRQRGLPARWETRPFPRQQGKMQLLASGWPEDGDMPQIHADARVWGVTLADGQQIHHELGQSAAYLVPCLGTLLVNDTTLQPRDGAVIQDEPVLTLTAQGMVECVMVELPRQAYTTSR